MRCGIISFIWPKSLYNLEILVLDDDIDQSVYLAELDMCDRLSVSPSDNLSTLIWNEPIGRNNDLILTKFCRELGLGSEKNLFLSRGAEPI